MRASVFLVLIFGIAAVVVFHVLRIKKGGLYGLFSKVVASVLFVVVAALASLAVGSDSQSSEKFYVFILLGLVCGLVGDMLLDLRGVYYEHKNIYTVGGMVSFSIGHVFYITAVMLNFQLSPASVLVPILVSLAVAAGLIFSAPLFKLDYKKFKPLCFVYAFFLSWGMCQAFAAAVVTNFIPVFSVMFIASGLFVVSDLILSHMYFSTLNSSPNANARLSSSPLLIAFNHSTYYAAQYLIALSILLI